MKNIKFKQKKMFRILEIPGAILLLLLSLLSAGLFIIAPITLNRIIQNVGRIGTKDIALVVILLMLGYFIEFLMVFTRNTLVQKYHQKASFILYKDIFALKYDKYLELGPTAIRDLAYNTAESYASFYLYILPNLIVNGFTILITIVIAWSLSPIAAILMLLTLPIHFFGFKILNKKLAELSIDLRKFSSESFRNINSLISQVDFIKQNPDNDYLLPSISNHIGKAEEVRKKVNYVANGASGLLVGLNQIIQAITIIYLSSLALKNNEMLGGVIYVMLVLPYFGDAVRALSSTNLGFAELKAADEFLKTLIRETQPTGYLSPPKQINNIKFDIDNVIVGENVLLNDVNMRFEKGDVIGIIGESGKGKSSLVKLIPKFRETTGIYINDDIPISDLKNEEYLNLVSYYSQYTPIITDTLLNNLNFGRKPLPEREYEGIKFLDKFKNMQKLIIENGANLSGGDKQRIALARYYTEKSQIIIFDEPTSSLDSETEKEILESILENRKDKIIFLISHNKDIMNYCTHIVELRDEKVNLKTNMPQ